MDFNEMAPTQDDIYKLLLQYMVVKGVMSEADAKKGWTHDAEKTYKELCHYLGVTPPITVPTNEELMPVQIVSDEAWVSVSGMEWVKDESVSESDKDVDDVNVEGGGGNPQNEGSEVRSSENGDLSFSLKTGLDQPKIPTEVEQLASTVVSNTEQVSDELKDGEIVTKEALEAEKKGDEDAENDVPELDSASEADSDSGDLDDIDDIDA